MMKANVGIDVSSTDLQPESTQNQLLLFRLGVITEPAQAEEILARGVNEAGALVPLSRYGRATSVVD